MNTSLRMEDVFQRILIQTMQALQVETVALGMIDGDQLVYRAAAGQNAGNIIGRKIAPGQWHCRYRGARRPRGGGIQTSARTKIMATRTGSGGSRCGRIVVAPIQSPTA